MTEAILTEKQRLTMNFLDGLIREVEECYREKLFIYQLSSVRRTLTSGEGCYGIGMAL